MINKLFLDHTPLNHHSSSESQRWLDFGKDLCSLDVGAGKGEDVGLNEALNDQGEVEMGKRDARMILLKADWQKSTEITEAHRKEAYWLTEDGQEKDWFRVMVPLLIP